MSYFSFHENNLYSIIFLDNNYAMYEILSLNHIVTNSSVMKSLNNLPLSLTSMIPPSVGVWHPHRAQLQSRYDLVMKFEDFNIFKKNVD